MARATWKPHEKHGELTRRSDIPDSAFAYPKKRKEPLTDARHVRNAVARFDQVTGVDDAEREVAFANIKKAAKYYDVDLSEHGWQELGRTPSTGRTATDRKRSAKKAAATRKRRGTTAKRKTTRKKKTSTRARRAGTSRRTP